MGSGGLRRVFLKGVNNSGACCYCYWDEHSSMGHKMALSVAMSSQLMCLSTRLHTLCPNATASCSGTRPVKYATAKQTYALCLRRMQIYAETNLINADWLAVQTYDKLPLGKAKSSPSMPSH